MSAREERLVTEDNLWELDTWLDKVDVFAKPHFDYVNGQLVNTGIKFGNAPTRMTAFIGDTIVRHEDGSHTVLSAKDAAELARLRQERHSTNEALSDAVEALAKAKVSAELAEEDYLRMVRAASQLEKQLRDRIAELETERCECQPLREHDDYAKPAEYMHEATCPAVPQQRQAEDPHDGPLAHDYALGSDLPAIPHQQNRRAL